MRQKACFDQSMNVFVILLLFTALVSSVSLDASEHIVRNQLSLLNTGEEGSDVTLLCGGEQTAVYAYSSFLISQSPYYRAAMSRSWNLYNDRRYTLSHPDISVEVMKVED
jgi:hypothetical protein